MIVPDLIKAVESGWEKSRLEGLKIQGKHRMNERIRELAEQATTKISFRLDPNTYKHIDDPEGDFERVEFDKQKFAELIVKECAKVILETPVKYTEIDIMHIIRDNIKEHFGVEE